MTKEKYTPSREEEKKAYETMTSDQAYLSMERGRLADVAGSPENLAEVHIVRTYDNSAPDTFYGVGVKGHNELIQWPLTGQKGEFPQTIEIDGIELTEEDKERFWEKYGGKIEDQVRELGQAGMAALTNTTERVKGEYKVWKLDHDVETKKSIPQKGAKEAYEALLQDLL